MSPSPIPVKLIRYLNVWRVNSSLVRLPRFPSVDLSWIVGSIIANRLSTQEAGPWRKALAPLAEYYDDFHKKIRTEPRPVPAISWPIEVVLFVYPGKFTYGKDELIFWELKLLGESADHGIFLEIILPALEEAGYTSNPNWNRRDRLWGHFDIHSVFVARGNQWEPLVSDGRLDLRYRPTPAQWSEGLTFTPPPKTKLDSLSWLTPFDFEGISHDNDAGDSEENRSAAPTLAAILEALVYRVSQLLPGKYNTAGEVMELLNSEEQLALRQAMERASQLPVIDSKLQPADKGLPGRWLGDQTYERLPVPIIRYLELASILHLGRQTHFGCGTFVVR